jgi:hypothetical protein
MIPVLDYFFYKIYKFGLSIKLNDSQFSALTAITLIEIFTLSIILSFLKIKINFTKLLALVLFLTLLLLNYLIFLRNNRYQRIKEKYENEQRKQRIIGSACVILYILLTIFFALYTI